MKKALMMAHVASMIDLFNMDNIHILNELGYKVDIACNFKQGNVTSTERIKEFKKEVNNKNIQAYNIPIPRRIIDVINILKSYIMLKKLVEKNEYEIVHCQSPIGGVIARLACKKSRKNGTKIIYSAHGFHFYKGASFKNWLLFYPIEKYCARHTDCIITMNQEDFEIAKKKMTKANAIKYIPGVGVDINKIEELKINYYEKRKELNIPNDSIIVVSVGELNNNKNHEDIIRAIGLLYDPNIYYIICGQGPLEQYLQNLCQNIGIEDKVRFLGYRKDVIEILKVSDIFAFPSIREGLSVSLMEAMAVGLPVVCSEIRGNTDLINHGRGGYLIRVGNIEKYAKAIKKVSYDKELCQKMQQYNRALIEKRDINNINGIMREIYQEIV